MRTIETLKPGESVEAFFLIHRAVQGVTNQGKPYLTLYLKDKSGDIEAKVWTVTEQDIKLLQPEKAWLPITVKLFGKMIVSKP